MSKGMIAVLSVGVAMLVFVACVAMWVVGIYNTGVRTENSIVAQYEQNQNNMSQYSNKVMEMVQVPDMYKNDYKEVLTGAIQGTYGKDGAKQAMLWLKERNIDFDSSLYVKIQDAVSIGRDKFENEQKKLIDRQRAYEDMLGTVPKGVILGVFGFPTDKMDDIKVVKSDYSNKAFESGVENGLNINGKG
jgi:hypothetical protein